MKEKVKEHVVLCCIIYEQRLLFAVVKISLGPFLKPNVRFSWRNEVGTPRERDGHQMRHLFEMVWLMTCDMFSL